MRIIKYICLFLLLSSFIQCVWSASKIVNVPLDERFATRVAFLNLARITPYDIAGLPDELLPRLKQWSSADKILNWMESEGKGAEGAIVSLQTVLYGSLIASRISNETLETVKERIQRLVNIKLSNPSLKIYASAVVMRIPEYDGDFQQPWFWKNYGKLLFTYSYYLDKYDSTHDPSDQEISDGAKRNIPPSVLQEFLWRRNRNQQVLLYLLNFLSKNPNLFEKFYISQDDNAQYGLNIQEAGQLKDFVKEHGLSQKMLIYPGADEVSFSLLAKYAVDNNKQAAPRIQLVFRNESTTGFIPNYEGIPMIETIKYQINAAGGSLSSSPSPQITLLVNNFDETKQTQAPEQLQKASNISYSSFTAKICNQEARILGFIDNRFSNGGDIRFVDYLLETTSSCNKHISRWAYAGWNTNGNTVGTVIANAILLSIYSNKQHSPMNSQKYCDVCSPCPRGDVACSNSYFNSLRILEDLQWQSTSRTTLRNYIAQIPQQDPNNLSSDLAFYEEFALKPIKGRFDSSMESLYQLPFDVKGVYYPWNRTFEIGIFGEMDGEREEQK